MAKKKEVTYFSKVRGLATVIWDPKGNKPLAEFDKQGLYSTSDEAVIEQLTGMGYRVVTAEQITGAGLMLPEDFQAMLDRQPGKGYSQDGGGRAATAMPAEAPGESPADKLFTPEGEMPSGPVGGGRTLVR